MSKRLVMALSTLLIGGAGALVWSALGGSDSQNAAQVTPDSDDSESAILKRIDVPEGPFDPVLQRPAGSERFTPPANRVVNDPDQGAGLVQSETAIWVSGDEIVVGWNDADGFFGGASVSGFGYSSNRGASFTDGGELMDGGGSDTFGDPSIVKAGDWWLYSSLDLGTGGGGLTIHRGQFSGGMLSWNPPVRYSDGGSFIDKEFMYYDSATGRTYLTYITGSLFRITRSTDDGLTWTTPRTVASSGGGNGAYPAPGIDGEVYVSWVAPLFQGNGWVRMRYSPDGGNTFPDPVRDVEQLGPRSDDSPQCFNRGANITFPSLDVDRSNGPFRGRAYMCWADGQANTFNVYLSYSDDKGATWSTPIQINDNDNAGTTEQFMPQLRVSEADGRVVIGWYDRRNNDGGGSLCDYYVASSVDGGAYWGPNRRLSDTSVAWCGVPADIQPNFGDYIAIFVDDRAVFGVWADAREGDPDVVFSRKDDRHLLSVSGDLATIAPFTASGTSWFIPDVTEWTASPAPAVDSNAQLAVAAIGAGLLGSPAEENGVFQFGGNNLSFDVTLASAEGNVVGSGTLSRTGANTINFGFDADADAALGSVVLPNDFTTDITVSPAGFGSATMAGSVTFQRIAGNLVFSVSGTVSLGLGSLPCALPMEQDASASFAGGDLTLSTKTRVGECAVVGVDEDEPLVMGDNPFPQILVGARPNPIQATTRISYSTDRDVTGAIRVYNSQGQRVRTIAEGFFAAGENDYAFDGKDERGRVLPAGGYFVRFENNIMNAAKKLFIVR